MRAHTLTHKSVCTWMDAFGHARRLWPNACDGHVSSRIAHAVHVLKIANVIASNRIVSNRIRATWYCGIRTFRI